MFTKCNNILTENTIYDRSQREILVYTPTTVHTYQYPLMHNKFIVFRKKVIDKTGNVTMINDAVWTGSYNFTKNASNSLENALLIENNDIADLYYEEWTKISAKPREIL